MRLLSKIKNNAHPEYSTICYHTTKREREHEKDKHEIITQNR